MKKLIFSAIASFAFIQAQAATVLPTVEYRFVKAWTTNNNKELLEELKTNNYKIPQEAIVEDTTKFFQTYTTLHLDSAQFNQNFINKVSDYGVVLNNIAKTNGITYGNIKEGNCTILNSHVSALAQATKTDVIQLENTISITDKYQNPATPAECTNALVFQQKVFYSATITKNSLTVKAADHNMGIPTSQAITLNEKSYLIHVPGNVFKKDERHLPKKDEPTVAKEDSDQASKTEPNMKYLNYFIFVSIK